MSDIQETRRDEGCVPLASSIIKPYADSLMEPSTALAHLPPIVALSETCGLRAPLLGVSQSSESSAPTPGPVAYLVQCVLRLSSMQA